jgi:hypothetical protein
MIVASMCTIPPRRESFKLVCRRILDEQSVRLDRLHVWLGGGYSEIPHDLPTDDRLVYHVLPKEQDGPWARYLAVDSGVDCSAFLTLDDDMNYPPDYLEKGVSALFSYNNPVAISFAGIRWDYLVPKKDLRYGGDRVYFSLFSKVETPQKMALGTGLSSFYRPEYMKGVIQFPLPGFRTNDDMMIAFALQKRGIPIICPPRPAEWLLPMECADTEHSLFRRDSQVRHETFRRMILELGFDPTAGRLADFDDQANELVVVSDPICDIRALEALEELANGNSHLHVIASVDQSIAALAQRHSERRFEFHPVVMPYSPASASRGSGFGLLQQLLVRLKAKHRTRKIVQQAKELLRPRAFTVIGPDPSGCS